jgi:acylglycerol lipase
MSDSSQPPVRIWPAASPRGAVVLSPSHGDPPGGYDYVARRLTDAFYSVAMLDHHGDDEPRGRHGLNQAVADLDALVSSQTADHPGLPVFLLGHSRGAAPALGYAIAHQARLGGLILSAPLAQVPPGRLRGWMQSASSVLLPDAPAMTLDPQEAKRDSRTMADYVVDPLTRLGPIGASSAAERQRRAAELMDGLDEITLATLLLWGTHEGLTPSGGAEHLLGALSHADLARHSFDSLYHQLLDGPERDLVLDTMVSWLDAHGQ